MVVALGIKLKSMSVRKNTYGQMPHCGSAVPCLHVYWNVWPYQAKANQLLALLFFSMMTRVALFVGCSMACFKLNDEGNVDTGPSC